MVAVLVTPTDPPVTIPDVPTPAIPEALLLHVPPALASVNGVVRPEHTPIVPVIATGKGFTVTTAVIIQPVDDNAYVMVAVLTVETDPPVNIPVLPTDAIPEALLLHTPPPVTSVSAVVSPEHTFKVPVIFAGNGLTVTIAVMIQPVPMV